MLLLLLLLFTNTDWGSLFIGGENLAHGDFDRRRRQTLRDIADRGRFRTVQRGGRRRRSGPGIDRFGPCFARKRLRRGITIFVAHRQSAARLGWAIDIRTAFLEDEEKHQERHRDSDVNWDRCTDDIRSRSTARQYLIRKDTTERRKPATSSLLS